MNTEQTALLLSILSVAVAAVSLGWNIYRDIVIKPRLRVRVAVVTLLQQNRPDHRPQYINITGVCLGPGPLTVSAIHLHNRPLWRRLLRKTQLAYLIPDHGNPLSARLPKRLEVGEKVELLLPFDADAFPSSKYTHVGLTDYFGRTHWCSHAEYKKVAQEWSKEFAGKT